MKKSVEIDEFNTRLLDNYGKDVAINKPRYQIVWSTDAFENRKGTYPDYNGDIFLRVVTEVRWTNKYPLYPDMWVLEHIKEVKENPELPDIKYSYEPLWVFGANNSERRVVWEKVHQMVEIHMYCMHVIMSPSDINDAEIAAKLNEIKGHKEILKDASRAFAGSLHAGEATTVLTNNLKPLETE